MIWLAVPEGGDAQCCMCSLDFLRRPLRSCFSQMAWHLGNGGLGVPLDLPRKSLTHGWHERRATQGKFIFAAGVPTCWRRLGVGGVACVRAALAGSFTITDITNKVLERSRGVRIAIDCQRFALLPDSNSEGERIARFHSTAGDCRTVWPSMADVYRWVHSVGCGRGNSQKAGHSCPFQHGPIHVGSRARWVGLYNSWRVGRPRVFLVPLHPIRRARCHILLCKSR